MERERVLITGGTAGIGRALAEALARRGMDVVVTGRDPERGRNAILAMERISGARVTLAISDASSVRAARALAVELATIDVLVLNAGAVFAQRETTSEGFERTLATSLVAPLALTRAFLPALRRSRRPRVVQVLSSALEWTRGDAFATPDPWVGFEAHARAKRLGLWALRALAREVPEVSMTAVNPGSAWTPGVEALTPEAIPHWRWIWPLARWFQRRGSPVKAAASIEALIVSPPDRSGLYFDEHALRTLPASLTREADESRALALADALAGSVS